MVAPPPPPGSPCCIPGLAGAPRSRDIHVDDRFRDICFQAWVSTCPRARTAPGEGPRRRLSKTAITAQAVVEDNAACGLFRFGNRPGVLPHRCELVAQVSGHLLLAHRAVCKRRHGKARQPRSNRPGDAEAAERGPVCVHLRIDVEQHRPGLQLRDRPEHRRQIGDGVDEVVDRPASRQRQVLGVHGFLVGGRHEQVGHGAKGTEPGNPIGQLDAPSVEHARFMRAPTRPLLFRGVGVVAKEQPAVPAFDRLQGSRAHGLCTLNTVSGTGRPGGARCTGGR